MGLILVDNLYWLNTKDQANELSPDWSLLDIPEMRGGILTEHGDKGIDNYLKLL